ncbi:MAG: alpha-1 4-glucan-protein synthase, partial [Nanohaloarchaea archaeon SW_7_46_7]
MVDQADICVITPTIRNPEFVRGYIENARENGFDTERLYLVLVTEDFNDREAMVEMLDDLGVEGEVFNGSDREAWYEENDISEY